MAQGEWDAAFADVAATLDRFVAERGAGGAAVCVYHRGRPVVDAWAGARDSAGAPWLRDTLAMSFSTTKGVTATALHLCVDRGLLDYDDPVAQHWPEFAAGGKESITVRQLLCHEAGLYDFASISSRAEDILDWERMVAGLESMRTAHEPGTANAYHAVTFGWLIGELVQRVAATTFAEFVATELAEPLGLDGCFIGTPAREQPRVAELLRHDLGTELDRDPEELVRIAAQLGFTVHPDLIRAALPPFVVDLRLEDALEVPVPAANGCFTARSLARLYAALAAGGTLDGVQLVSPATMARAIEVQNRRADLVLAFPVSWRLGYHGVVTSAGIVERGFGHMGLGGSGAWADPDRELAVALTLNALGSMLAGDERLLDVGGSAVRAAAAVA